VKRTGSARRILNALAGSPVHRPAVDGWVLPRSVDSALASGRANLVPVIVGSNRDEEDSAGRRAGAYHSAEITFVFDHPRAVGHAAYDSALAEAMSDYWVSFATSLDPNGPPNAGEWPEWPRYDRATQAYLELGPEIVPRAAWRAAAYDSLDAAGRKRGEVRP
jgi:para-nitrobenzyl esterase